MSVAVESQKQAVSGLVPPQSAEARIRVAWPSVQAYPAVAHLGRMLTFTYVLAPLAWLLMTPFYFKKILPFLATRYAVTNRRVAVLRGLKASVVQEVPLADIDEVKIVKDGNSDFFRAAALEIISKGKPALTLAGVPSPEAFRQAILNAAMAWVVTDVRPVSRRQRAFFSLPIPT
jgi:hypothetical protein